MNSNTEYQAIPVGPDSERPFKQESNGRSRSFSLIHLTPSKAAVLATTIVCVTFAAVHYDNQPLTQTGNGFFSRSTSNAKGITAAPNSLSNVRLEVCEFLKSSPSMCSLPYFSFDCQRCGISHQNIRESTAAPNLLHNVRDVYDLVCKELRFELPTMCSTKYRDHYKLLCEKCGVPDNVCLYLETDPGTLCFAYENLEKCKECNIHPW